MSLYINSTTRHKKKRKENSICTSKTKEGCKAKNLIKTLLLSCIINVNAEAY